MTSSTPQMGPAPSPSARRALTRHYKETRRPAGVFTITNRVNGRVYVDGSLNLDGTMNRHRFELNLRSHRNRPLQQDWLAHGADNFVFAVIDRLKERDDPLFDYQAELESLLALWREEIPCQGERGYNGAAP